MDRLDRRVESIKNSQIYCRLPEGGKAGFIIRKHYYFTPTREIRPHVRALARNHPEGWKLQRHVSLITTRYLTYRIGLCGWRSFISSPLWTAEVYGLSASMLETISSASTIDPASVGGKACLVNSQTQPLHDEGNQTTREGTSPQPVRVEILHFEPSLDACRVRFIRLHARDHLFCFHHRPCVCAGG